MVPAFDGGDDFLGIGGPDEGLWMIVGFPQEAINRGLEIDDRAKHAAFEAALGQLGKKPSRALSQEAEAACSGTQSADAG